MSERSVDREHFDNPLDYAVVRAAIEYLTENAKSQPDLETLARAIGEDPFSLQKLFKRWAGISPKSFLQALTLDHAKHMLRDASSILDTSYEVGLSSPGRLHDLFCLLYTSPSPRDLSTSRMPSSA